MTIKPTRGIIYCYTSPSNKKYIGQTINETCRRSKFKKAKYYTNGGKIDNAREKYGVQNFKYEILFEIIDIDKEKVIKELNKQEEYYIRFYNTVKNGYNCSYGGRAINTTTEETINKIKQHTQIPILQYDLKGNFIKEWNSIQEACKAICCDCSSISANVKGKIKQVKGYIFKYKTRNKFPKKIKIGKLRNIDLQHRIVYNNRACSPVLQYDKNLNLIKEYNSVAEASRETKICNQNIHHCCRNERKTAGGFIWKYKD